jgi:hypothetical protein
VSVGVDEGDRTFSFSDEVRFGDLDAIAAALRERLVADGAVAR